MECAVDIPSGMWWMRNFQLLHFSYCGLHILYFTFVLKKLLWVFLCRKHHFEFCILANDSHYIPDFSYPSPYCLYNLSNFHIIIGIFCTCNSLALSLTLGYPVQVRMRHWRKIISMPKKRMNHHTRKTRSTENTRARRRRGGRRGKRRAVQNQVWTQM